jgi:hypothetical protein
MKKRSDELIIIFNKQKKSINNFFLKVIKTKRFFKH